jgi:Membrane dipeptidase (Peptidase family M19)
MKTRTARVSLFAGVFLLATTAFASPQNPPQGGQTPTPQTPQTRLAAPPQTTNTNATSNVQRMGIPSQAFSTPLKGWVDLHAHLMGHLGFGGKLLYGGPDASPTGGSWLPADPSCIHNTRAATEAQALGHDASVHGGSGVNLDPTSGAVGITIPCANNLREQLIHGFQQGLNANDPSGDASGYPLFTDWPKWNDLTHQRMWVEWIRRAYQGGLRVMVALAVNNKTLGDAATVANTDGTQVPPAQPGGAGVPGPAVDLPTDDKTSADIQIDEIKKFVARHSDFMEVALSSDDVYRIVSGNPSKNIPTKVAVVIGMEVDHIGNFQQVFYREGLKTPLSEWGADWQAAAQPVPDNAVRGEIDRLYNEGVRYLFPIHLLDNAFGGTATYVEMFNISTMRESGHPWSLVCTNDKRENITWAYNNSNTSTAVSLFGINLGTVGAVEFTCPDSSYGQKNRMGLTHSGIVAITEMMRLGMLIDVDHMSEKSEDQALQLACYGKNQVSDISPFTFTLGCPFGYPLNSGHSGPRGALPGLSSERSQRLDQYAVIGFLHGMAGVGSANLSADRWLQLYNTVIADMQGDPTYAKPYDLKSPFSIGGASSGVAAGFGADFNGLEFAMPPRSAILAPGTQYSEYRACVAACKCTPGPRESGCVGCSYAFNGDVHIATTCDASCKQKYPNAVKALVPAPSLKYTSASGAFPQSTDGQKSWNYNTDGVAHYGMLWDFLQDVRTLRGGTPTDQLGQRMVDNNFMYGADYFYRTWAIAEERSKCVQGVDQSGAFFSSTCLNGTSAQQVPPPPQPISVAVCPSLDGKSCTSNTAAGKTGWDIVSVTSRGTPVAGVTVSTNSGFTAVTDVHGMATITIYRGPCYAPGSQLPQVGRTGVPKQVPCPPHTATVLKQGYQSEQITLP